MTIRIAHLSDIHFGGEDIEAVEASVAAVHAFAPTLTVVTGDLTLNGQPEEFLAARRWLGRLPSALMVTPGNHDTPYWNLVLRALTPFKRYRRYIGSPNSAVFDAPGLAARCLNSARGAQPRPNWSEGALTIDQVEHIAWGEPLEGAALRLFGCHHPLIDIEGAPVKGAVHRGEQAVTHLAAAGVELILTGHVHVPFMLPLPLGGAVCYSVGAGTLSCRTRGTPASFSTIVADAATFEVTALHWTDGAFQPAQSWSLPRRR